MITVKQKHNPFYFTWYRVVLWTLFVFLFVFKLSAENCYSDVFSLLYHQELSSSSTKFHLFPSTADEHLSREYTWRALDALIWSDAKVDPRLIQLAREKIGHFAKGAQSEEMGKILWGTAAGLRTTRSMEYLLQTFKSQDFDQEFRRLLIAELSSSPSADEQTMLTLLTVARGHSTLSKEELKLATEGAAKIGQRLLKDSPEIVARVVKIKEIIPVKGGFNNMYMVTLEDGSQYIFKPRQGEVSVGDGFFDSIFFEREVSAPTLFDDLFPFLKDDKIQMPKVQEVSVMSKERTFGIGSLQPFHGDYQTLLALKRSNPKLYEQITTSPAWREQKSEIQVLDYLLGNHDRFSNPFDKYFNQKNIMVKVVNENPLEYQILLIDNAIGRPGRPSFDLSSLPPASKIPDKVKRRVFELDEQELRTKYQGKLSVDGINDLIYRLNELKKYLQQ